MSQETRIYEQLRPAIETACAELQLDPAKFRFEERANFSSIYFGSLVIFRIRCRGQGDYLEVKAKARDLIPEDLNPYPGKTDSMIRIPIQPDGLNPAVLAIVRPVIEETVKQQGKDFDCCDRYMECSDARQCVRSDFRAFLCGYRKVLKSGRVFFGKNRNV